MLSVCVREREAEREKEKGREREIGCRLKDACKHKNKNSIWQILSADEIAEWKLLE